MQIISEFSTFSISARHNSLADLRLSADKTIRVDAI